MYFKKSSQKFKPGGVSGLAGKRKRIWKNDPSGKGGDAKAISNLKLSHLKSEPLQRWRCDSYLQSETLTSKKWTLAKVESSTATRSENKYETVAETYPDVTFTFHISRRSPSYRWTIVIIIIVVVITIIMRNTQIRDGGRNLSWFSLFPSIKVYRWIPYNHDHCHHHHNGHHRLHHRHHHHNDQVI